MLVPWSAGPRAHWGADPSEEPYRQQQCCLRLRLRPLQLAEGGRPSPGGRQCALSGPWWGCRWRRHRRQRPSPSLSRLRRMALAVRRRRRWKEVRSCWLAVAVVPQKLPRRKQQCQVWPSTEVTCHCCYHCWCYCTQRALPRLRAGQRHRREAAAVSPGQAVRVATGFGRVFAWGEPASEPAVQEGRGWVSVRNEAEEVAEKVI